MQRFSRSSYDSNFGSDRLARWQTAQCRSLSASHARQCSANAASASSLGDVGFGACEWTKEGMSATRGDGRSGLPKEGRSHDPEGLVAAILRAAWSKLEVYRALWMQT